MGNGLWKLLGIKKAEHVPEPQVSCNISDEMNEWNKLALAYAWRSGGSIRQYPIQKKAEEQETVYTS